MNSQVICVFNFSKPFFRPNNYGNGRIDTKPGKLSCVISHCRAPQWCVWFSGRYLWPSVSDVPIIGALVMGTYAVFGGVRDSARKLVQKYNSLVELCFVFNLFFVFVTYSFFEK